MGIQEESDLTLKEQAWQRVSLSYLPHPEPSPALTTHQGHQPQLSLRSISLHSSYLTLEVLWDTEAQPGLTPQLWCTIFLDPWGPGSKAPFRHPEDEAEQQESSAQGLSQVPLKDSSKHVRTAVCWCRVATRG